MTDKYKIPQIRRPDNKKKVGVVVKNDTHILLVRTKGCKKWGIPKGSIQPFEALKQAGIRELYEETGISLDSLDVYREFYKKSCHFHVFTYYIHNTCLPIPSPIDTKEIEGSQWFPISDISLNMMNYFTKFMFSEIKKIH